MQRKGNLAISTNCNLRDDSNVDKLINKVSNLIEMTTAENKSNKVLSKRNRTIKNSNFKEDPEMSGKVWTKDKLDMKSTISTLMSNLSKSLDTRDIMKQIKMLEARPKGKGKIMELLPPNKQSKIERKIQYDTTQKGMKRWGLVIDHINRQEIIKYGATEKGTDIVSTAQLSTNYEPMDEFEREFDLILKDINKKNGSNNNDTKVQEIISPCDRIKDQAEKNFIKKLKFILFQQQKENKRLKKIKSKTWRKNRRKQMQAEEEKLLSLGEVEYPELVKKIREKYEEKRARIRLMRRHSARQKWAKMATRFGGRDLQKTISDQAQKQHDEKKRIEQIIENTSKDLSETDDDIVDSEDENAEFSKNIEDIRDNINQLKNISQNLSDLKFIQRSVDLQNKELDTELLQIESGEYDLEDYNDQYSSGQKLIDENSNDNINSERKLKELTFDELQKARDEVSRSLNFNNNIFDLDFKTKEMNNEPSVNEQVQNIRENQHANNISSDSLSIEIEKKKKNHLNIEDELENMSKIDLQENSNSNDKNHEIIKQIFVQGNDEYELEDKPKQPKEENIVKKIIPGWGNWCSSLLDISSGINNDSEDQKNKKRPLIRANNSLDKKISKYCVSQAPHPYNSNELYESTLKHPIGPEWNTTAIHNRLIQPKIQAKIGAVIKPLVYSKHLKNIQISDSFLEKWNQVKKCNRTKARF